MLTGHGSGTRAEIIQTAKEQAARYFGTGSPRCVTIDLSNETATIQAAETYSDMGKTIVTGFTADWSANEEHRWEAPSYGFPKCVYCKKEARR